MAEYLFRCVSEKLSQEKEKLPANYHEAITWLESKFSWLGSRSDKHDLEKQRLLRNWLSELTSIAQETENAIDNFLWYVQRRPPLRLKDKLLARWEMPCMKEKFSPRVLRREEVSVLANIWCIRVEMEAILTSSPSDENIIADPDSENSSVPKVAASIYDRLDDDMKLCFLFHGLFPEGFKISKRRLFQLWIAEGWVQEGEEDTATIYEQKMATFTGASLLAMQEFCIMRAKQLNLYTINKGRNEESSSSSSSSSTPSSSSSRGEIVSRLALHTDGIYRHMDYQKALPSDLRSLFCFPRHTVIGGKASFLLDQLVWLKLLRVLDLEDMYFITELPDDMGKNLTQLRYLGLRRTGLERLPLSLDSLTNLQTLDIKHTRVCSIPKSIEKLKGLRCLYMDMDRGRADGDDVVPPDFSVLEELCVLTMVRVDRWMETGIKKLFNLRKLGVYGELDLCRNALLNCLPRMYRLEWLRLGFGTEHVDLESILTSLKKSNSRIRHLHLERPLKSLPSEDRFLTNIGHLCLKWSQLMQDPMPTLGKLPRLKVLKLCCGSFLGKKIVCSTDGFQVLNVLELNLLEGLEEWIVEERAMPELNRLVVHLCERLKMLPQTLEDLEKLEELDVGGMPLEFSARLQKSMGDDWFQIIAYNTGLELESIRKIFFPKSPEDWGFLFRRIIMEEERIRNTLEDNMGEERTRNMLVDNMGEEGIEMMPDQDYMGEERMKMLEDNIGKDWISMVVENFGEDWSKIQHINSIIIDGIQIQMGSTSSHQASSSYIGW